jgi:hypothetical protein
MPIMTELDRDRHGTYRVRRIVPEPLRAINGKTALIESLGTKDPREAKERAPALHQKFDEMIRLARQGEWPPLAAESLKVLAHQWAQWLTEDGVRTCIHASC